MLQRAVSNQGLLKYSQQPTPQLSEQFGQIQCPAVLSEYVFISLQLLKNEVGAVLHVTLTGQCASH